MKINNLEILNFMRIGEVDADLSDSSIHLFAGYNEAGKSSLQEAIRYACYGETVRVKKKGDYKMMVKDGAKKGNIKVTINDVTYNRDVASGDLAEEVEAPPDALRYSLDAHLFSKLNSDNRRQFLFRALGIKIKPADMKKRMLKRDIDEACIDAILPLLLTGGFGGAHNEAKKKTTEARGVWKGITGETYGAVKAESWKAEPIFGEEHAEELAEKVKELSYVNDRVDELMVEKGSQEVTGKPRVHEGIQMTCPQCETKLSYKQGVCSVYVEQEEEIPVTTTIDAEIAQERRLRDEVQQEVVALEVLKKRDSELDKITESAKIAAESVLKWKSLEEILAPDGLPAEIISEAIDPVNKHLKTSAIATGWKTVSIGADMEIEVDGRPYTMQSESSKWRADTLIAEAISHLTGTGILVLDRVDVLDMSSRIELIKWVMQLVDELNYQSVLMFATLKEPPKMPAQIAVHWVENGGLADAE